MLGVSMDDEGWKVVKPFLPEKMKITYPVVIGDHALAQQFGGINNLPVTLLIDRDGPHCILARRRRRQGRI